MCAEDENGSAHRIQGFVRCATSRKRST
jgi:hypothetical protein